MTISISELRDIVRKHFPTAIISITDLVGDENHYSLVVTDSAFQGLSLIEQHRRVKHALADVLNTKLHAITIKTYVPQNE